ncbi:MAG: polysaccharide pyruvyl transferase family protein [Nitrospirae bacterium]|nr:polysaccharide pyruvyl transferase family protein [Nitrospirota bacterium]MCL5237679.1 polysaccharide pyruvyl transferase family protein [Nitrospirota bacterium]
MLKVTIAEPIPSLNKGEAAILRGIQEALKVCGDVKLTLFSPHEWIDNDRKRYGTEINLAAGLDIWGAANAYSDNPVHHGRMYYLLLLMKFLAFSLATRISKKLAGLLIKDDFLQSLADSDLIIAGHDGMLSYDHFWIVLAGKLMNKPVALYGGGNDFNGRIPSLRNRMLLQSAIRNAIICTVRDENTRNSLLANDIPPGKVHLFPDPAVLLKPCRDERVHEILKKERIPDRPDKPLYGLIPVIGGIVYEKSFSSEKDAGRKHELRIKLWVDTILHLLDTTDAHLVLIPHCIGPGRVFDDRRMMQDIYRAIPRDIDRVTLIAKEYSEGEYKGLMKRCAFVLGERAHALIGAVSVGTPCIALSVKEDIRMHNIISRMFKRKVINLNNPDVEGLKKDLTRGWKQRKAIAAEMAVEAVRIQKEALRSAELLKESIEQYYAKAARSTNGVRVAASKQAGEL